MNSLKDSELCANGFDLKFKVYFKLRNVMLFLLPQMQNVLATQVQPIAVPASTGSRRRQTVDSPSLSPTEAKIRDGLRRSARLQKEAKSSA